MDTFLNIFTFSLTVKLVRAIPAVLQPVTVLVAADDVSVAADKVWFGAVPTLGLVPASLTVLVAVTFPAVRNTFPITAVKLLFQTF